MISDNLYLGRNQGGNYYDGDIDQFSYYTSTVLSQDDVTQLYNQGSGNSSNPPSLSSTIFSYQASNGSVEWNIEGDNMVFRNGDTGNSPVITATHGMSSDTKYNVAVSRDGSNNFELLKTRNTFIFIVKQIHWIFKQH